jgi:hypothetical protein
MNARNNGVSTKIAANAAVTTATTTVTAVTVTGSILNDVCIVLTTQNAGRLMGKLLWFLFNTGGC